MALRAVRKSMRLLAYTGGLLSLLLMLYSILWFMLVTTVVKELNSKYANRYIEIEGTGRPNKYFISFSKIHPYGFPFSLGIKIIGWTEENNNSKITFHSAIFISYDILRQLLRISYPGSATSMYKPIESGFGAKFSCDNSSLMIKIPLSLKLFKIFSEQRNEFEIVNYIKNIKIHANNVKIFDLVNNEKLYDEAETFLDLSFEKSKYYVSLDDFLNNIPKRLDITYNTKILASKLNMRKVPTSLVLYRLTWPYAFTLESKMYIKTNSPIFENINKDIEINVIYAKADSHTHQSTTSFLYRNKESNVNNIGLKVDSEINLKPGFADSIFDALKYLRGYIAYLPIHQQLIINDLEYIINNPSKFSLGTFENKQYKLGLDLEILKRANDISAKVGNFSLFGNTTGIHSTLEINWHILKNFDLKGTIGINNYKILVGVLSPYIYQLGKFKLLSEEARQLYIEAAKVFLKNISNYPHSTSNDLLIEYAINGSNLEKAKIGNVNIKKLQELYYLSLLTAVTEQIKPGDNIRQKVIELIPDFANQHQLLDQYINKSFKIIEDNVWQEIINN